MAVEAFAAALAALSISVAVSVADASGRLFLIAAPFREETKSTAPSREFSGAVERDSSSSKARC
jgi:hypothetical protein